MAGARREVSQCALLLPGMGVYVQWPVDDAVGRACGDAVRCWPQACSQARAHVRDAEEDDGGGCGLQGSGNASETLETGGDL